MTPSFVSQELSADSSPSFAEVIPCVTSQVAVQRERVGKEECRPMTERDKPANLSTLSDEDLQDYIHVCAEHFLTSQELWELTGDFACIGERDRWWGLEAAALRERASRAHLVRAMEIERGLA